MAAPASAVSPNRSPVALAGNANVLVGMSRGFVLDVVTLAGHAEVREFLEFLFGALVAPAEGGPPRPKCSRALLRRERRARPPIAGVR